ncbi:Hypothetical protein FKW44_002806 [Caligus rogercresseyi]|uniref:Uncharacterized protein n=1 Tax=Caligus rogercresseyi TaxID=217165 RepID=A0A7T8KKP8_CALRO|nr:Hypothetical protein FKW44_002806 [Caligus rogercresseyi]
MLPATVLSFATKGLGESSPNCGLKTGVSGFRKTSEETIQDSEDSLGHGRSKPSVAHEKGGIREGEDLPERNPEEPKNNQNKN